MPPSPPTSHHAVENRSWKRFIAPIACVALLLLLAGAIASIGVSVKSAGLLVLVERAIGAGGYPFLWCAGALGLGRLASPLVPRRLFGWTLQLICGLAIALFLAHLLGAIGIYRLPLQRSVNAIPVAIGVFLLIHQLRARNITSDSLTTRISPWIILTIPALAVIWVGASCPPGALWGSPFGRDALGVGEAHGYDVLSYHLQLPREWLASGRIATLDHNVYSALPSYMEAAYTQLAGISPWGAKLSSGNAIPLYTAQILHAGFALAAALAIARLARAFAQESSAMPRVIGAAAFLSTPWVIVCATTAYNEMGVCALFAGALLALRIEPLHPTARGIILGGLLGVACGCKPTAFFMTVLPTAAAALILVPRKHWIPCAVGAAIAGFIALAPWLIRNWIDTGNPVFPFATSTFGSGHWSPEQAARWANAHTFTGSLTDRLALLFSAHRGVLHPQWSIALGIIALSIPIALLRRETRKPTAALAVAIVAQLIAWLSVGHLQARFLIPILVPGCTIVALACAAVTTNRTLIVSGVARIAFVFAVLVPASASIINYLAQRDTNPNAYLIAGAEQINGSDLHDDFLRLSPSERESVLAVRSPEVYANLQLAAEPLNTLYLLGDATPLYFDLPLEYATTWDTSPIIDSLDRAGWSMPVAADLLREEGITHVLISIHELMRLRESGYIDPRLDEELAFELTQEGRIIRSWIDENRYTVLIDLTQPPLPPDEPETP